MQYVLEIICSLVATYGAGIIAAIPFRTAKTFMKVIEES